MRLKDMLFCDEYSGDYGVAFGTDLHEKMRELSAATIDMLRVQLVEAGVPVKSLDSHEVIFDRTEAPNVFENEFSPGTVYEGDVVRFSKAAHDLKKHVIEILTAS